MSYSLSVSIVTYELDPFRLRKTLCSLVDAIEEADKRGLLERYKPTEIAIIDNGSNRRSIENIARSIERSHKIKIRVLFNDENVGYGRAHNQFMLISDTDFHIILNPDVEISPYSLTAALTHLSDNLQTILIGPFGTTEKNNPANLAKRYPTLLDLMLRGLAPNLVRGWFKKRLAYYEYADLDQSQATKVTILSGCMMVGRTDLLKQSGGFDPAFFLYFEDFDLSLRASEFGDVIYLPSMKIVHYGGNAAKKGISHVVLFISSAFKFFNKHGWRFY